MDKITVYLLLFSASVSLAQELPKVSPQTPPINSASNEVQSPSSAPASSGSDSAQCAFAGDAKSGGIAAEPRRTDASRQQCIVVRSRQSKQPCRYVRKENRRCPTETCSCTVRKISQFPSVNVKGGPVLQPASRRHKPTVGGEGRRQRFRKNARRVALAFQSRRLSDGRPALQDDSGQGGEFLADNPQNREIGDSKRGVGKGQSQKGVGNAQYCKHGSSGIHTNDARQGRHAAADTRLRT